MGNQLTSSAEPRYWWLTIVGGVRLLCTHLLTSHIFKRSYRWADISHKRLCIVTLRRNVLISVACLQMRKDILQTHLAHCVHPHFNVRPRYAIKKKKSRFPSPDPLTCDTPAARMHRPIAGHYLCDVSTDETAQLPRLPSYRKISRTRGYQRCEISDIA